MARYLVVAARNRGATQDTIRVLFYRAVWIDDPAATGFAALVWWVGTVLFPDLVAELMRGNYFLIFCKLAPCL